MGIIADLLDNKDKKRKFSKEIIKMVLHKNKLQCIIIS